MLIQLIRNQQGRLPAWLGIVIIVIILIIIYLLIAFTNRPAQPPEAAGPQPGQQAAAETHSVSGSIISVTKNQFQVLVAGNRVQQMPDKVYTVNYDENTQITKRRLPESVEPGEQVVITPEAGDVTELVTNVDVTVTTEEDASRTDIVYAKSIELRY